MTTTRALLNARGLLAALAIATAVALLITACGGDDGDAGSLTVYSGRSENLVAPLIEQFSEQTGVDVDVRYGDSADLALLIAEEGDRTPADVFFSQSPGAVGFLAEEGVLAPISPEVLALVDERSRNESGLWVGITGRQRVLVYNEEIVDASELPGSVFELTEERFAGRVAIAPENGSFQDFVTAMRHLEGDERAEEWLCAMAETDPPVYSGNSAIVDAVSRGEVDMGLVNHYYNFRFLAEDPSLPSRNHLFDGDDPGALLIVSAATVLERSDQPEAAEQLIAFLLGEEAQRYFAEETFEYPLVATVPPAADLPPLESLAVPEYDIERLGGDLRETALMIAECGLVP